MMQQAPGLAARSPLSYRMGIDIGSVTAKVVVLGPQDEMIFSAYRRHRAETSATLCSILQEASESLGDVSVTPMITGSAGMGVSERYDIPFVQEMIASAEVVKRLYPQVRTLIDIGGEDAKLIYFHRDGMPDMRMNGTCAGGTGAYIDEMAALLNVPVSELGALAERVRSGLSDGIPLRCVREDGRSESAQPRGRPRGYCRFDPARCGAANPGNPGARHRSGTHDPVQRRPPHVYPRAAGRLHRGAAPWPGARPGSAPHGAVDRHRRCAGSDWRPAPAASFGIRGVDGHAELAAACRGSSPRPLVCG